MRWGANNDYTVFDSVFSKLHNKMCKIKYEMSFRIFRNLEPKRKGGISYEEFEIARFEKKCIENHEQKKEI